MRKFKVTVEFIDDETDDNISLEDMKHCYEEDLIGLISQNFAIETKILSFEEVPITEEEITKFNSGQ